MKRLFRMNRTPGGDCCCLGNVGCRLPGHNLLAGVASWRAESNSKQILSFDAWTKVFVQSGLAEGFRRLEFSGIVENSALLPTQIFLHIFQVPVGKRVSAAKRHLAGLRSWRVGELAGCVSKILTPKTSWPQKALGEVDGHNHERAHPCRSLPGRNGFVIREIRLGRAGRCSAFGTGFNWKRSRTAACSSALR